MSVTNRVILSDNGTLTDVSKEVLRYQSGTAAVASWVAAEDYLYVGSLAPFNHFYVKLSTVSVTTSNVMTVQYWDGKTWVDCHKVDDETAGFTASGYVTFYPDRNTAWVRESTNDRGDSVTGLTGTKIYDMYWVRIKFSLNIGAGFTLSWIGQKFSDDSDLAAEMPRLTRSSMLSAFITGKTDWEEQHVKAGELIVQDLIAGQVMDWSGQILVREEFTLASVYKVAQIIFSELGDDYLDQHDRAEREYKRRLDKSVYRVDKNQDGLLNQNEGNARVGFMSR